MKVHFCKNKLVHFAPLLFPRPDFTLKKLLRSLICACLDKAVTKYWACKDFYGIKFIISNGIQVDCC